MCVGGKVGREERGDRVGSRERERVGYEMVDLKRVDMIGWKENPVTNISSYPIHFN